MGKVPRQKARAMFAGNQHRERPKRRPKTEQFRKGKFREDMVATYPVRRLASGECVSLKCHVMDALMVLLEDDIELLKIYTRMGAPGTINGVPRPLQSDRDDVDSRSVGTFRSAYCSLTMEESIVRKFFGSLDIHTVLDMLFLLRDGDPPEEFWERVKKRRERKRR